MNNCPLPVKGGSLALIELKELRCLVALSKLGSISLVAEQLHLSPPAIHKQLKILEEERGIRMIGSLPERTHMRFLTLLFSLLILLPAGKAAGQANSGKSEVFIIPFSHLDLFWGGTEEECLSRGNRIITRAIQLSQQYPEFRFLLEDNVFVANFVESQRGTAELEALKKLVKEGRIEIAPKWVGTYQNLPRGEALVRNLVHGKRYAREVFGVDPKVAHLGDIPGYTWQYPQILSKSATPYMVMTRMAPTDQSLFRWKAPDGSDVLTWHAIKGYGWGVGLGLHRDLDDARFKRIAREISGVQATTTGPIYLDWGTDLWAPNTKLVENVSALNQRLSPGKFRLATPEEYFRAAAQTAVIPNISGEIPSSWANVISSMSHLWPPVITATDTLLNAEKFAAINYALGYAEYPDRELESLWKKALEAMDHNNYGQGGDIGDERKVGYAQAASLQAGQILRDSLRNIAERVEHPFAKSTPIVVFNPLGWARDDIVRAHVTLYGDVAPADLEDYRKAMRLVDEKGTAIPFRIEQYSENISRAVELAFIARGVPSLGYKTYYLVPADQPETFTNACDLKLDADNLVISALKKADRDSAVVLRVFDISGGAAQSSVHFLGQDRSFQAVNMLEEDLRTGDQKVLRVQPYEINTLKVRVQ